MNIHTQDLNQFKPVQKLIDKYDSLLKRDWSTRFKIGFPIETRGKNQLQGYVIHEFLVTID